MPDDPDVTPEGESSPPDPILVPAAVPAAQVADDRPVQNMVAEMNRKFQQVQQRLDLLTQRLTVPVAADPPDTKATSEELWEMAKQGSREAFDLYMERIAERKTTTVQRESDRQRVVENQLSILAARYPVLNDSAHPLSQATVSVYQTLLASGEPQSRVTLLEAIKTAIADRPDLIADLHAQYTQAQNAPRASAASRARAGQTGVTLQPASVPAASPKLSKPQLDLAKRMGVKDAAKSMERFHQRRAEGKSHLGAVANYLEEEI